MTDIYKRLELCRAGHTSNPRSGISRDSEGATAVVLSNGYEDDVISAGGNVIYYTGTGKSLDHR